MVTPFDRLVARVLLVTLVAMTPMSGTAGDEFDDANNTTFDDSVVTLDNSQAGQTTFTIDTNRTTIGWEDLQQPESNTLEFNFTDSNSIVLNPIGAQHPSNLNGTVISNGTVAFSNPFGIFIGDTAVINVGDLIAIGANVSREDFMASRAMLFPLTGTIENNGLIRAEGNVALLGRNVVNNGEIIAENGHVLGIAGQSLTLDDWNALTSDFLAPKDFFGFLKSGTVENHGSIAAPNAALMGGRVVNFGEIEITDGSLLMVAADAVWVTEFDNPVLIKIPNVDQNDDQTSDGTSQDVQYAIENHGRIDAGLGHVRLAASDPLGFAIRQGTGSANAPASIAARRVDLEGGETGRVHLAGTIDASDLSDEGVGGEIDVTGSMIVLEGATVQASGSLAGGTIHIGGEQEGRGDLQRARVVVVDEDSAIRADATQRGDGGTVIVFAEDLTSVDGEISARGGWEGGDGGFVETSGLRNFHISRTPDLSAPSGAAGSWLIDPFNITVSNTRSATDPLPPDCPGDGISCFNKAIDAILSPNFDDSGFDGILRTVNPDDNVAWSNVVEADLIADALATGTDVTLSTQAFGLDRGTEDGDIDILDPIVIDSADTLEGTTAKLTFLAARNINVEEDIRVDPTGGRTNLALSVELRANDASQVESDQEFDTDRLEGDILINADIITGGGDVTLTGASVVQQVGRTIDTDGGSVDIRTGTVDENGFPLVWIRQPDDPSVAMSTPAPRIEIAGSIDSSDGSDPGGDVIMVASSLNVSTSQSGNDLLEVVTGQLTLKSTGQIQSGGGNVTLVGGSPSGSSDDSFAGSVDIAGDIVSAGGSVQILANHVDPDGDTGSFDVSFVNPALGEGGVVDIDADITTEGGTLSIGGERTQSIQLDGTFSTTQTDTTENGIVQLVALDLASVDSDNTQYGFGEIIIGAVDPAGTTISTSALEIEARDVSFSEGAGVNTVTITASGSSTATPPDLTTDGDTSDPLASGEVRITGNRQIIFNQNTEITGETIRIVAAPVPTELNFEDPPGIDERSDSETRLVFGGTNGTGQVAADGVRLNGDLITISVGDGTTASSDLFSQDLGTSTAPTDFGLQRLTRAAYDGLQLRDSSSAARPEEIRIAQDGDFTITNAPPTSDGQLDLGGAFDTAVIGSNGMRTTLESSDGVLTIEDAAALNNNPIVMPDSDDGKSFVVLNGGLFLPDSPDVATFADDTVVFGDGMQVLGSGGTTAFDVESLSVSTPRDFTVRQQVVGSITAANELVFEAGRNTGAEFAAGFGTLTVEAGIALQADDRLALLAGASGFGDLDFAGGSTTLAANDLDLRAGGGIDSENSDSNTFSRITGLQTNVTIRDANGAIFGDLASSATSFSYRQDAAIDAKNDLPDLAQFGLDPLTGFRASGDVEYKVRSDQSNIDLLEAGAGDRFRNAALSLVGLDQSGAPAIDVSSGFTFVGKRIELGGVTDFRFTQILADAFNRSGSDADEEITLRAGLATSGNLSFDSVIVKAPRINLVAGSGLDPDAEFLTESEIDVSNAKFDLTGSHGSDQTFVFETTSFLTVDDLPDKSQFIDVNGVANNGTLPDILAIRNDIGLLEFTEFDVDQLPIDLTDDPGRLILEGETIALSRTDGGNLELTSIANLNLRLRTNNLILSAVDADRDAAADAQVLIPARAGDILPLEAQSSYLESELDDESLFIEAFDSAAEIASVENFSSVSEDPTTPGQYDPDQGHGPTDITIQQDGAATQFTLFNRNAVSGRLERTILDDDDGMPIATAYTIQSTLNPVTVEPENVNGSSLILVGVAATPLEEGIIFEFGTGSTPGVFDFENLFASTESSILIKDGTQISANDSLSLAAALLPLVVEDPGMDFGKLDFEAGTAETSLTANKVLLTAGPSFVLDGPDTDGDGEREPIDDGDLPQIDFTNLDAIFLTGIAEDSLIDIRQSASLDSTRGTSGDYLTPLEAGFVTDQWAILEIDVVQGDLADVVQGDLILNELNLLKDWVKGLIARTLHLEATLVVNVPDASLTTTPFADFGSTVELESNDMKFVSTDLNTAINLATDNLFLVSTDLGSGFETEEELSRLRSDPDALDRPIVRIHQAAAFADTELARPDQYVVVNLLGQSSVRSDLNRLDIELKRTDGGTLTFDDDLRKRVTGSNLILDSVGDLDIMLDGPTPGYADLDYAALQLTSFDVITGNDSMGGTIGDGMITIRPFMIDGNPEPLTVETTGDQSLDGELALEATLSTRGRDIRFTGDVIQTTAPDAGLRVSTSRKIIFEGNIGSSTNPLDHLWISFDNDTTTRTPNVEFGERTDENTDGISETPVFSDQEVWILEDILFAAYDFHEGDLSTEIENAIGSIGTLSELEGFLETLGLGRKIAAKIATIGKALGDLSFNNSIGHFIMASGEKLSVGGTAEVVVDPNSGLASLGDVSALVLDVDASDIGLVRRDSGVAFDRAGESQQDAGPSISANTIDFGTVTPVEIGPGREFRFGVPNPFDTANLPAFLGKFALFEIYPSGQPFVAEDFRFLSTTGELADQVPSLRPTGASRSDLSGAFGPKVEPTPKRPIPEIAEPSDSDRLLELAVDAHETPNAVRLARLESVAVINDLGLPWDDENASVTIARIDAEYADAAIALYKELFGRDGERSGEVREVLQEALDRYLANTRAQRVVGFELRRFVKNRPSTLLKAYRTLESLDALFRYHRRLGLSPGEFRRIQQRWLRRIQPDGITLDELAETIHPSRYVRGSDILDIFGR